MNNNVAISAKKIGKAYKIFKSPASRLNYYLFKNDKSQDFWALKDIDFEIKKGETFGIIGKNGSGKSTLLQILAGILKPTEGVLTVNGKIAALLELGSGFNPESTGIENVYMNAAILGINKEGTNDKLNEIIEFADIGEFINRPVKTYSSGMYVRLAFAVAINVDADIIIIDEALAVGDIFFRQKCYKKLNELKEQGKTIILVTHAMGEVEEFCERAILLDRGKQVMLGRSQDAVKKYYILSQTNDPMEQNQEYEATLEMEAFEVNEMQWKIREEVYFDLNQSMEVSEQGATFIKVGLFDKDGKACRVFEQGEVAYFYYEIKLLKDIKVPIVGVAIYDERNNIIHGKSTLQTYTKLPKVVTAGTILKFIHRIELRIKPEEFTFEIGLSEMNELSYEKRNILSQQELFKNEIRICHRNKVGHFAVSMKNSGAPCKLIHHGMCDLPVEIDIIQITKGE
jgi:ABC-type polysaccharide/polyol phosphate transport system ATPase subunit